MPLFSIDDTDTPIDHVPHGAQYRTLRARLSDAHFDAISGELNTRIDGHEVRTSSWLPGSTWEDTVFFPIYLAAGHDRGLAGKFFGQIVWEIFMNRYEDWSFIKGNRSGNRVGPAAQFWHDAEVRTNEVRQVRGPRTARRNTLASSVRWTSGDSRVFLQ